MRLSIGHRTAPAPPAKERAQAGRGAEPEAARSEPGSGDRGTSVAGDSRKRTPVRQRILNSDLLTHTTPLGVAWILFTEFVVVGWTIAASVTAPAPTAQSWLLGGIFALTALLHIACTRIAEERRRAAHLRGEHIDHTGIWTFAAALVLPVPLIVALVVVIRSLRYMIARKPLGRLLFTTSAHAASALAAHTIAVATPIHGWFTGTRAMPATVGETVTALLAITAACAAYYVVQTIIIGIARGFRTSWAIVPMLGTREENFDFAITLSLGLVAAATSDHAAGAILLAVMLVAIAYTRLTQRLEQLETERNQLKVDALHDPLTGLPNRRSFNPAAEFALVTDAARNTPTAMMMFDLDLFKQWNTDLGHIGADQVLKAVAQTLRENTRDHDLLCRWGGEELAVMLPHTDAKDAAVVAERVRAAVADLKITVTKPMGGRPVTLNKDIQGCTISCGVAISTVHGTELLTLQEAADRALQSAKDGGRNRVCFAQPYREHWTAS